MDGRLPEERGEVILKKLILLVILLLLLLSIASCEEEKQKYIIRNGSRDELRIAITIDDCYAIQHVQDAVEISREFNVPITFFPIGTALREEDGDIWRSVIEAGCEIGSHTWHHIDLGVCKEFVIIRYMGMFQELLDKVLGYHYRVNALRPPFGKLTNADGNTIIPARRALMKYGFEHAVNWDVSQTDPDKAFKQTQNGSILLFHTRQKDIDCLRVLIPKLLEAGFVPVTVSELLGFGDHDISDELFVWTE